MTASLRLMTLGGLEVRRREDGDWSTVRVRPLASLALAAAAMERTDGLSRDALMSALWPDDDDARGRNSLNGLLTYLRNLLGDDLLLTGPRMVALNASRISVDFWELDDAVAAGDVDAARRLYEGPFLAGIDLTGHEELELLATRVRERANRVFRGLLLQETQRLVDAHRAGEAKELLQHLLAIDPLDNVAATRLLVTLADGGELTAAARFAADFRRRVLVALGVEPDPAFARESLRVTSAEGIAAPRRLPGESA